MPGLGRVSKQLVCAHCDAVIATAVHRPLLSWRLDITSPEGYQLAPLAGSVQLRIARQELASASPDEEHQARWRADFIGRHLPEVIYDLPCPRGHRTLVTEPQIARAIRKAQGSWVVLTEAAHLAGERRDGAGRGGGAAPRPYGRGRLRVYPGINLMELSASYP